MTSDAALVFSNYPNNIPTIGLHQYRYTIGQDLAGIFCITVLRVYVKNVLVPYTYLRVLQHMVTV